MAVLRTDIERALDELVSNEEGMRFQGLAVVLGKRRWPELIACERKKDFGLDAYAAASFTSEHVGKGLASSITPTLKKISRDAETAKENFSDLRSLLFVTPAKVGNTDKKNWGDAIQKEYGLDLHIMSREDIITELMTPENAPLCSSFLYLDVAVEPALADLLFRTKRAAAGVTAHWAARIKSYPLIDLDAVRLETSGAESNEVFSIEGIDKVLSQSQRLVLEAPAGRGKTTMLVQLAQRARAGQVAFIVNLPAWVNRRTDILDYLSGIPSFRAQGLSASDLARLQTQASFLFLLNGWNEIAQSNSTQADDALRELEYNFPAAGIIVATRTHHLTPPLLGATRLRLFRLRRLQRTAYLSARLGARAGELRGLLDADHVLDELTRTPFILAEIVALFEAGVAIPNTKAGVLEAVIRLQEQGEHRNALYGAPLFGRQQDYLQSIATEMTRRGAVTVSDPEARAIVVAVKNDLVTRSQIGNAPQQPAEMLAALAAHHLLERVDYPEMAFQFEHQHFQEYYAANSVRSLLFGLHDADGRARNDFIAHYVNQPAWEEPLRMIAEMVALAPGNGETHERNVRAGRQLVEMALSVDPVFAAELAQLCGTAVWAEVRATVGPKLRALYAARNDGFRQCALASILATGSEDFKDIIVPLLSAADQQVRLRTYRLWPDMLVWSLGQTWREEVHGWSEEARADFVSELLRQRLDVDVAAYAAEDNSASVKKSAVGSLLWTGSDEQAARVLESMDAQTFADVARKYPDRMPARISSRTIAVLRRFIENTADQPARLLTALGLTKMGEVGLEDVLKDALAALARGDIRNLDHYYLRPALDHLRKTDPVWATEWVAVRIADGDLYPAEHWISHATAVPAALVERYLQRLETEDLPKHERLDGVVAIIAARADPTLAARLFSKLRELRRKVDMEPRARHEFEWQITRQLATVFRALPSDVAVAGTLTSIRYGSAPLNIKVAADLFSRVARTDLEPLCVVDESLKARLRTYLRESVDVVLREDDFDGQEKANLASSISQVGTPEDMADLVKLIRADIDRMRRGRAARADGDRGPLGNGSIMTYAGWHIASVVQLDPGGAEQVLIELLGEPEYLVDAASAMARDFPPKSERSFGSALCYEFIWTARSDQILASADNERRIRYAAALKGQIKRLLEQRQAGGSGAGLKELAKSLAAVDSGGSANMVLEVIALPGQWDEYTCLDAAERLLINGVVLPSSAVFVLVDAILARTEWMQDSDRYLLRRVLALCAFVDDPTTGIAKIRDTLARRRLWAYELRELVTALGESRCDAAVDLLCDLASDARTFEQCEDNFINAFATLDTPRALELLVGFVDPDVVGIASRLKQRPYREDVLVARLTEIARRDPDLAARLRELCERDLPELNREILSKLMDSLGTPEALAASLNLLDDDRQRPVPRGVWEELEGAFVERRPHGENLNVFTQHARAANALRNRLFRMATEDRKRRKSAYSLLGQIEEWRLKYGRPPGEPRHPDFASGQTWPPKGPDT